MVKQNHILGILCSFLGYTAWVVGDICLKLAGDKISVSAILVVNLAFSTAFTMGMAAMNGGLKQLYVTKLGFHALRSLIVIISVYGFVAGVVALPLADFYTITFTSPLIMTALGHFFIKEKTDLKNWLAALFGFAGVIVAVRFSSMGSTESSWAGILATAIGALSTSIAMLMTRARKEENNYALSFWPALANLIVAALWLIWKGGMTHDLGAIGYAALSGIVGGIGVLLTNASLRLAPAAIVAPYHYTQIIGGMVFGYLIWQHIPEPSVVIGSAMIALSGLYILHSEQRKKQSPSNLDSKAQTGPA